MLFLFDYCNNGDFLTIVYIILKILSIACYVVPILLILMLVIDFVKAIISDSVDTMRKNIQPIVLRIVSCMAIFLAPNIVMFSMGLLDDMGVPFVDCLTSANVETIKVLKANEAAQRARDKESKDSNQGTVSIVDSKKIKESGDTVTSSPKSSSSIKFQVDKRIVIGHFSKKVNHYTIVVRDRSGRVLDSGNYNFKSSNPGIVSVSSDGVLSANFGGEATVRVTAKDDTSNYATIGVLVVHSLYTKVKVKSNTTGVNMVTGMTVNLPANTEGIYNGVVLVEPNHPQTGDIIRVGNDYIKLPADKVKLNKKYYVDPVYSPKDVELFVNTFGFGSDTGYLFWTNQGTQTQYMFTGSKGNWKLHRSFLVNTGDTSHIIHREGSAITGIHFNFCPFA